MSQENVEIVRAAFEAISRGDVDAMLTDAAPDFELDWSRALGPQRGVYCGADEVVGLLREFDEPWESVRSRGR